MEKTSKQLEKNVCASFGYVKKDILMLNDSYTNMQEAITQLASSYKVLAEEIKRLRNDLDKTSQKKTLKVANKKIAKKTVISSLKAQHIKTANKTTTKAPMEVSKKVTKKVAKKTSKKKPTVKKVVKETTVYE